MKKFYNKSDKNLQIITSPNPYLGRDPHSANRNNVVVDMKVIPPLNNKRKVYTVNFKLR